MERIVFLDRATLKADVRRPGFAHEWREYDETALDETIERVRNATIVITNKVRLGEKEFAAAPDLHLIVLAATGTDNIDLNRARERNIKVMNARGYAVRSVAEHVFMLIFALRRNLMNYAADVRRGEWARSSQFCLLTYPIQDIEKSTLGIIGYGAIGRTVAEIAEALGMNVLVAEHKGASAVRKGRAAFEDVLRRSDVITLHAPLDAETRGLIGWKELSLMPHHALLINTGRGGLVDEIALLEFLRERRIGGAGVDVLSEEPPRGGNPLLDSSLPNLIVTPHVAWASAQAMQHLAETITNNLEKAVMSDE
jgi:glycerate dehydrogenase